MVWSVSLMYDLTTLKRAEASRRESEQTIGSLLESAPQAILAVSQEGRIVFVNRMAGTMFGYPATELAGRPLETLIPKMAGDSHSSHLRHCFSNPHSRPMGLGITLTALRRDRTVFPVEISLSFIEGTNLAPHQVPESPLRTRGGLAVAFIADISERKRLEATAEAKAKEHALQIQALSASLLTSHEDERRRLSRELHDGLCQQLALLSITIGGLIAESLPGAGSRALKMLQGRADAAADVARHLAHQLHPSILDDLGLVVSLQSLCDEFSAENSIPVRFTRSNVPLSVSRETASSFYRIAQQSLRNIAQHAGPCHVLVDISSSSGAVILSIEDDGVGFDPVKVRGRGALGLTGMQERARLVNGTLCIASRPRQGTRVEVEIPCPDVPQEVPQ
jgi:PAS domain S-box-containing protein